MLPYSDSFFLRWFVKTSYACNRLILQSNGGTVAGYANLDFIGISAGHLSARWPPTSRIEKRSPAPTGGHL
jgi:hypothetical protein